MNYFNYIELIKAKASEINRNTWKIPYGQGGYILYRQYGSENYIDICDYSCFYGFKMVPSTMKCLSTPEKFYKKYFGFEVPEETCERKLSYNQFRKIKPKPKRLNGNFYCDDYGRLYLYNYVTRYINGKENLTNWNKYKDYPDAVLVRLNNSFKSDIKLFHDEWEAIQECKSRNTNPSMSSWNYTVLSRGVSKTHPKDRLTIYRIPYFPLRPMFEDYNIQNISLTLIDCLLKRGLEVHSGVDGLQEALEKYKSILEFEK